MMLSEKENEFVEHWKVVRAEYATWKSKLYRGLPMAIIFSIPILLSISAVEFFSPEWFTKLSQSAKNATWPILLGIILIVLFFSVFRMHFQWEENEQIYQQLLLKKETNKD